MSRRDPDCGATGEDRSARGHAERFEYLPRVIVDRVYAAPEIFRDRPSALPFEQ
jgi:hypothetical protein